MDKIIILILLIPVHFFIEKWYGKTISNFMRKSAEDADNEFVDQATEESKEYQQRDDIPDLSFNVFSHETIIEPANKNSADLYKVATNLDGEQFFEGILIGLLVNVFLSALFFIVYWSDMLEIYPMLNQPFSIALWTMTMSIPYFIAIGIAYILHVNRNGINWAGALLTGIVANSLNFLNLLVFSFAEKESGFSSLERYGLLLPLAGFILVVLFFILNYFRKKRILPGSIFLGNSGIQLLILRVFGVKNITNSLFGGIGRRWQHAGPILTIIDRTYALFEFRRKQLFIALSVLLFLLAFIPLGVSGDRGGWNSQTFIKFIDSFLSFYIPLYVILVFFQFKGIRNKFSQNLNALVNRISFQTKSNQLLADRYQQGTMYCHANLWRSALKELVDSTNLILMDLRTFNKERMGCQYEINYLLNHFPLSKAIFMIDEKTDQKLLEEVASSSWTKLRPDSPNRGIENPAMNIYFFKGKGKKDLNLLTTLLCNAGVTTALSENQISQEMPVQNDSSDTALSPKNQLTSGRIHAGIIVGWSLIVFGFILQFFILPSYFGMPELNLNLDLATDSEKAFGLTVLFLGIILLMLFSRLKMLSQRDGNFTKLFKGFPWPMIFWIMTFTWLMVVIATLRIVLGKLNF